MDPNARKLLAAHHQLDFDCRNRAGRLFVSDWYCEHSLADEIVLSGDPAGAHGKDLLPYYFQNDEHDVHHEIRRFHAARDGVALGVENIFVSAGLSPLITAQMVFLRRRGVRRLFYVRPLYYTYYFLAESLGIELVPVNADPLVGSSEPLRLPGGSGEWLVLCDPIWYLGRNADGRLTDYVRSWQESTGGMVMVDGAFQYQRWTGNRLPEPTSTLLPDQTIRNLCPTKAAATHGPRFAYAIIPDQIREELRYCYSNTAGPGSLFDKSAALSMMRWLNSTRSNDPLLDLIRGRYENMVGLGLLDDPIGASASYFCFVLLPVDESYLITMDQRFFDTTSYPGFVRFNLLLPRTTLVPYIQLAADAVNVPVEDAVRSIAG